MSPTISCSSVYKIFGDNAGKLLSENNGKVDAKKFQEAGWIVGVNDASFDVNKGEMLVVMGLSGSGKSTKTPINLHSHLEQSKPP
jgi:glycine betaine/proline transport system ATP-binding protein